jgi:hypothetical protein
MADMTGADLIGADLATRTPPLAGFHGGSGAASLSAATPATRLSLRAKPDTVSALSPFRRSPSRSACRFPRDPRLRLRGTAATRCGSAPTNGSSSTRTGPT